MKRLLVVSRTFHECLANIKTKPPASASVWGLKNSDVFDYSTMQDTIVRLADLPNSQDFYVEDSSFCKRGLTSLPTPAEVRDKAAKSDDPDAGTPRPAPVLFKELGVLVKYGLDITIAEGQCLLFLNKNLKDDVPTPELFGWCYDDGETFLYMELIEGDTLGERWSALNKEEKQTICQQLKHCVDSWRGLRQEEKPYFLGKANCRCFRESRKMLTVQGHIGRQGIGDIIFHDAGHPWAGPFNDLSSFHDFFARFALMFNHDWDPRKEFPELAGLTDERPVVFTHADLARSNILISTRNDQPPRVTAIIDWHQSGWYPSGWEYLKALSVSDPEDQDWRQNWLSQFLAPPDDGYWLGWEFIISCRGL